MQAILRKIGFCSIMLSFLSITSCASVSTSNKPAPVLRCATHSLTLGAPGMKGAVFSCAITGAPSTDTSFSLSLALTGQQGASKSVDPLCTGTLSQGQGQCQQSVIAPVSFWGGSMSITGKLLPGGTALGPTTPTTSPSPTP